MLDPTTFPNAKSEAPFIAAFILTISSGAEVANETTVIPITILEILSFNESATADFNNQFPPKTNKINPTITNKKFMFLIFHEDTRSLFDLEMKRYDLDEFCHLFKSFIE